MKSPNQRLVQLWSLFKANEGCVTNPPPKGSAAFKSCNEVVQKMFAEAIDIAGEMKDEGVINGATVQYEDYRLCRLSETVQRQSLGCEGLKVGITAEVLDIAKEVAKAQEKEKQGQTRN